MLSSRKFKTWSLVNFNSGKSEILWQDFICLLKAGKAEKQCIFTRKAAGKTYFSMEKLENCVRKIVTTLS